MGTPHDHTGDDCECIAFRLISYWRDHLRGGVTGREAVTMAFGVTQGARAALLHPEWAQALVREDDERLSDKEVETYRLVAHMMVEALPVIATTEPPEPPA